MMKKEGVLEKSEQLYKKLSNTLRVKLDKSDKSPGWKYSEYEMKGVPVRLEIGPRDIEANQAVLVRRDTREKIIVSLDNIENEIQNLLDKIQFDLYNKALNHMNNKTAKAETMEEFEKILKDNQGFIKAMWCGNQECEDIIKEKTGATSRCMPFEQEHISDKCICCGKPAEKMVIWAKAY